MVPISLFYSDIAKVKVKVLYSSLDSGLTHWCWA